METLGQHLAWNKTAQINCEADKTMHACVCVCRAGLHIWGRCAMRLRENLAVLKHFFLTYSIYFAMANDMFICYLEGPQLMCS